ncbi:hypothetical protein JZO78_14690 [Enterococcus ureilyticus]|uniref:hypothetical protein n=1 Tax=Enterococcus ureilyticus TaxID=1131292 RepID=UPI001A91AD95|nr:hypothetical protein [Enterococcus ureilyticus]MBO0447580.1 hypothetical protein [Enterococcus ureilyticus]
MRRKWTVVSAYILIFGFLAGIIDPRLGTLVFNCALGLALIVGGWQLKIKQSWIARIIFALGVLWFLYLFLYYVTGFNNPQF